MHFTSAVLFLASSFVVAAAGVATTVKYDTTYDSSAQSMLTVACSDGDNGLYTKGYLTFGALPSFPNIGAAAAITGWNSPQCGKCFKLYYKGKTVYITGVDSASGDAGFVLSRAAMDSLTGGLAVQLGSITASYAPVASSFCGM